MLAKRIDQRSLLNYFLVTTSKDCDHSMTFFSPSLEPIAILESQQMCFHLKLETNVLDRPLSRINNKQLLFYQALPILLQFSSNALSTCQLYRHWGQHGGIVFCPFKNFNFFEQLGDW
jgi:hypothetical protein